MNQDVSFERFWVATHPEDHFQSDCFQIFCNFYVWLLLVFVSESKLSKQLKLIYENRITQK